jgi:hypothetical protein
MVVVMFALLREGLVQNSVPTTERPTPSWTFRPVMPISPTSPRQSLAENLENLKIFRKSRFSAKNGVENG